MLPLFSSCGQDNKKLLDELMVKKNTGTGYSGCIK